MKNNYKGAWKELKLKLMFAYNISDSSIAEIIIKKVIITMDKMEEKYEIDE